MSDDEALEKIKKIFDELNDDGVKIRCSLKDNPMWINGYHTGYDVARTKTIIEIQKILEALIWEKRKNSEYN